MSETTQQLPIVLKVSKINKWKKERKIERKKERKIILDSGQITRAKRWENVMSSKKIALGDFFVKINIFWFFVVFFLFCFFFLFQKDFFPDSKKISKAWVKLRVIGWKGKKE